MHSIILTTLLSLLLLSCGHPGGKYQASDSSNPARTGDTQTPESGGPGYTITQKEIREERKRPAYTIEAHYPEIAGMNDTALQERINRESRDSAMHQIAIFRNDVEELAGDDTTGSSSITIADTVTLATPELLSATFTEDFYTAGAAHPGSITWTMNYDLASGRRLALADLFLPGEKYLGVISKTCIDTLKKRLGDDEAIAEWVAKGASPQEANFVNFSLHTGHLRIIFDEYQIGPHAVGTQDVSIPYSALEEVIAPQGPLRSLLR